MTRIVWAFFINNLNLQRLVPNFIITPLDLKPATACKKSDIVRCLRFFSPWHALSQISPQWYSLTSGWSPPHMHRGAIVRLEYVAVGKSHAVTGHHTVHEPVSSSSNRNQKFAVHAQACGTGPTSSGYNAQMMAAIQSVGDDRLRLMVNPCDQRTSVLTYLTINIWPYKARMGANGWLWPGLYPF